MTIHVKVIKFVPIPDRVPVGIEINDDIACDVGCAWQTCQIGERLHGIRNYQPVAICKLLEVVGEQLQRDVEPCSGHALIELRHC